MGAGGLGAVEAGQVIDGCTAALPPQDSVGRLNFRAIVDGLGGVLFQYPFR